MAKARKAKKAPARKAASKRAAGATKTVSVSSSFNPHSELAKLKAEKEAQEKRIAEQRAAILAKGIEVTEAALERAIAARDQAQNRVDALQQELHGLKVEAGLARGAAAKGKGRRGRPAKSAAAPKALRIAGFARSAWTTAPENPSSAPGASSQASSRAGSTGRGIASWPRGTTLEKPSGA